MTQRPIAISVIAPVAVAGIFILTILATSQAFAQEKPTLLTVSVSPDTWKPGSSYHVTGKLTCEGQGVGGATITFTHYAGGAGVTGKAFFILPPTQTNSDGTYSVTGSITKDTVIAHFAGDSEHMPAHSRLVGLKYEG